MTTRMLIDARHPEETRVAVLKGNRIEEFDFDSADHKQIKGNIYLAKVTRVEPSLQAAFVDFGGNRHGFLAFSEIHPDYYQIPKEDREALLAEEAEHAEEEAALRAAEDDGDHDDGHDDHDDGHDDGFHGDEYGDDDDHHDVDHLEADGDGLTEVDTSEKDEVATLEDGIIENGFDHAGEEAEEAGGTPRRGRRRQGGGRDGGREDGGRSGGRAATKQADEVRAKRMALRRRYKIQDVIQRRQVLLVQVVKEERGNKGAALTTYLSLAGRYCVLMPNSSHGGGISRKISSVADRKRLKSIIAEMQLPKTMGCIVRTAGLQRTKTEIKRDFDYLARLWDEIRENTLGSSAPALIHSDSDLIKRAIRDIYNRDIVEIVIEGDSGYRDARDFMKLLMPSHARRVKAYADPVPLFQRYGAEDQLSALYDPVVQLKSGGYLVINPTEALVSIDINSGRSTKEHGIEATAVNTNLEAAREIARQLRLRDMAGLVVIDFIDMEYGSNNRKVEKAMKDALKDDRARIQLGRISSFGLMEMSRQRLRTGVLEATTRGCPHCDGSGLVRTAASSGLSALRLIEEEAAKGRGITITLFASQEAAVYLLNAKRADLAEIEARYGVLVEVIPEGENEGAKMRVGSSGPRNEFVPQFVPIAIEDDDLPEEDYAEDEEEPEEAAPERRPRAREDGSRAEREGSAREGGEGGDDDGARRGKRRKRRRSRGPREEGSAEDGAYEEGAPLDGDAREDGDDEAGEARADGADHVADGADHVADGDGPRKRRRRSRRRRGGRGREDGAAEGGSEDGEGGDEVSEDSSGETVSHGTPTDADPVAEAAPAAPKRRGRSLKVAVPVEAKAEAAPAAEAAEPEAPPAKPARGRRKKADAVEAVAPAPAAESPAAEAPAAKPKRGRAKKADAVAAEANTEAEAGADAMVSDDVAASAASEHAVPAEKAPAGPDAGDVPAGDDTNADGTPRRGWWQRTFGE